MDTDTLALVIIGLILFTVLYTLQHSHSIIKDIVTLLKNTPSDEKEYVDSELYIQHVKTIRMYGYLDSTNYKVHVGDADICSGGVTRRGLVTLMEDIGFPTRCLLSPLGKNLINAFAERRLIGQLSDDGYIILTYTVVNADHYQVYLEYSPVYHEDAHYDYIGNTVRDVYLIDEDGLNYTLTDVLLRNYSLFNMAGELPDKYDSLFRTLISLGNCITGVCEKHAFEMVAMDINSPKSSTPTLYVRYVLPNAPSDIELCGIDSISIEEEFNRFIISQGNPLISHSLHTMGGKARVVNDQWYEDIKLNLTPSEDELNSRSYYIDITITKRRLKHST